MNKRLFYLNGILILFLLWLILSLLFDQTIFPYPWQIFIHLFNLLKTGSIYQHLALTLLRTLCGFLLALTSGLFLGLLTGSFDFFEKSFFIPTVILQGAPPILWVIPLMLILGTEGASPIAVVFLVVLPLVMINIQEGMKSIQRQQWEMFKIYAHSRSLILFELIIPSLAPYLKSIFILGIVLALKSSLVGEWFGAKDGIGRMINEYFYTFDMLSFYSVSFIFITLVTLAAFFSRKVTSHFFRKKNYRLIEDCSLPIFHHQAEVIPSRISIKKLSFFYAKKQILDAIDFNVDPGQTIVLTGQSGCGKTTFAKICTGLIRTHSGQVQLAQNPCLIFQDDVFLPHLDCFGNAALPGRWKKSAHLQSNTLYYLERCGLLSYKHYFPDQLSGGMKKRLTFARALVLNPDFVILDEPFNNLHKQAREELWDLYFELFAGRNIPSIIITHYPEELKKYQVLFYEMHKGKILTSN